ncbi:MAG: tripartite tricarboxylate transporter substrate binding protein [Candidatus Azotimanducaceae bacterium]|uniref:Tripartite tricarboxylate transporter substrate binding protein n=1 Tax=OM182 bacterium TaxID=2510334 RepID=A0A520S0E5_9GAMM|nr:tripartite tricarboxylate transporter substrate-binding protein [Gammaproteobacteria bacterium]OUV67840.1 MAG: transporter [Gammaproteobacteria bacterium TMED133]RZO75941.1 MAG: tripartite tricarboxylate transporter substrate binding protein [OM182 bacterium]
MNFLRLVILLIFTSSASTEPLERIHFLIPAGPGGGWDGTARGVGEALIKSGLMAEVSFENLSGGGGGKAIAKFIETAPRQKNTLLISSTPIIVRSLQGIFPQSFRDLQPIASVIADYSCFAVRADSPLIGWNDITEKFLFNSRDVKVAGGSVRGSTDHFVIAKALSLAGGNPRSVRYIPYDGGGKAMAGLLTGETHVLSTGLSEAIEMHRSGEIRIVAISAPNRLKDRPDIPTLVELGFNMTFANWRGFFAAPGYSQKHYQEMAKVLEKMLNTHDFEIVRARNGWAKLHMENVEFYNYLMEQETQIGSLMRALGFLKN